MSISGFFLNIGGHCQIFDIGKTYCAIPPRNRLLDVALISSSVHWRARNDIWTVNASQESDLRQSKSSKSSVYLPLILSGKRDFDAIPLSDSVNAIASVGNLR